MLTHREALLFKHCHLQSFPCVPGSSPLELVSGQWPTPTKTWSQWTRWWGWTSGPARWLSSRRGKCGGNCGNPHLGKREGVSRLHGWHTKELRNPKPWPHCALCCTSVWSLGHTHNWSHFSTFDFPCLATTASRGATGSPSNSRVHF